MGSGQVGNKHARFRSPLFGRPLTFFAGSRTIVLDARTTQHPGVTPTSPLSSTHIDPTPSSYSYGVDAEHAGMSGEEYQAKLGQVLAKRHESVTESSSTAATGLNGAYALVAKELRLAGTARNNNAHSNNTGTPRGSVHRRPSMESDRLGHRLLSSIPRRDSSGGAATTAATAFARGSRFDTPSRLGPGVKSLSQTIGGGGSGSGGGNTVPFLTSRRQPSPSGSGGPPGAKMTGARTGLGDGNAVEGCGREGGGLGWGGGGGVDSKVKMCCCLVLEVWCPFPGSLWALTKRPPRVRVDGKVVGVVVPLPLQVTSFSQTQACVPGNRTEGRSCVTEALQLGAFFADVGGKQDVIP